MRSRRADWFLTAAERDNADTSLDRRHADGTAWTEGNDVEPLVHGATYFRVLLEAVAAMGPGDRLSFTDWRGDPDERLDGPGSEVGVVLAAAARRGVDVRGLVWRSHLDRFQFSASENRHLGAEIEAAGGQCLLDQRVRVLGSHHQKLVVLRHPDAPDRDVAFVGGIDLCHSRRDDERHEGDPQRQPMAAVYGTRPPWHDVQLAVRGPAVGDADAVFRERWNDTAQLSRNPLHVAGTLVYHEQWRPRPLPRQLPDPPACGPYAVQLLRTYPRRLPGYPFARRGERSVARGYRKALARARRLVYLEDQYLWSSDVVSAFADALAASRDLRMIVVVPRYPDQDGALSLPPNLVGRTRPLRLLRQAGRDRVAVFSPENLAGVPVYVHAKVCVVDDVWLSVGSDNANRRSWTHDSELTAAVLGHDATGETMARRLRHQLAHEHLGSAADDVDLDDPAAVFDAFRRAADALEAWHRAGGRTARPPGRLRPYEQPQVALPVRLWADPLYRLVYDPDGRPLSLRLRRRF